MLVLTKKQAIAFETLREKGPKEAIDLIVEYRIKRKWSWSRIRPGHSVDFTPLEWVDNIELIMAMSTGEYGIEKDVWEDTKSMGEAVLRLSQGYPIRSMIDPDKVRATYHTLADLEKVQYIEIQAVWQYLNKK